MTNERNNDMTTRAGSTSTQKFRTGTIRAVQSTGAETDGTVPVRAAVSVNPGAVRATQVLQVQAADVHRLRLGTRYAWKPDADGRIIVLAVGRDDVAFLADTVTGGQP